MHLYVFPREYIQVPSGTNPIHPSYPWYNYYIYTFFTLDFSAAAWESGSSRASERGSEVVGMERGSSATPPNNGSTIVSDFLVSLVDLEDFVSTNVCFGGNKN